ncbi:MAG: insulinase family protein [Trueperaceae bacterium]|nr:MAG: insulinase family protein [Trueperaceae bacterium]
MPWLATVSLVLLLPVGSANDPEDGIGSAAILSEWLQRGAGERDARGYADALDALGVRRGGGVGRETLSLSAAFLQRDTAAVLPLLADAVRAPLLGDASFEGVRALALQDLDATLDSPAQRAGEALVAAYFESAHGRSAYGERSHLERLTPAAARADAAERIGPAGAVLAIAGGIDVAALPALLESTFGAWRGASRDLPAPLVRAPHERSVPADSAQVQIGMATPAVDLDHPGWYAQQLALAVLDGNMGARLFSEVREKRGLVYSVSAGTRLVRGHAYLVARAGTTPERAAETIAVVAAEIARLRAGVEADELERAAVQLRSSLVMSGEASGARASRLASDVMHLGRARSLGEVDAALAGLGLDDVNAFLAQTPEPRFTSVTLGPVGAAVAS